MLIGFQMHKSKPLEMITVIFRSYNQDSHFPVKAFEFLSADMTEKFHIAVEAELVCPFQNLPAIILFWFELTGNVVAGIGNMMNY